jgi:hypothetical protein
MSVIEDDGLMAISEITGRIQTRKDREDDRSELIPVRTIYFSFYPLDVSGIFLRRFHTVFSSKTSSQSGLTNSAAEHGKTAFPNFGSNRTTKEQAGISPQGESSQMG